MLIIPRARTNQINALSCTVTRACISTADEIFAMKQAILVSALLLIWTRPSVSNDSEKLDCAEPHCALRRPTIPTVFVIGQSYPNCTEDVLSVKQGSTRFEDLLTYNNTQVFFYTSVSRVMSKRLFAVLEDLARAYYSVYGTKLYVTKSWTKHREDETFISSLHYEGENGTWSFRSQCRQWLTSLSV